MCSIGKDFFLAAVTKARDKGRETSSQGGRRILSEVHNVVAAGIVAFLEDAYSGKPGRLSRAAPYLKRADPDLSAHLALRGLLDTVSKGERFQKSALSIATAIEDELHFSAFRKEHKKHHDYVVEDLKKKPHAGHRHKVMTFRANRKGVEWEEWSVEDKMMIGAKLIEIVILTTGMFHLVDRGSEKHTVKFVEALPDTRAWVEEENERSAGLSPLLMPTIIPPKPWTTPFDGGYWSGRVRRLTLVKTGKKAYLEELAHEEMPAVYEAVNAMQDTAWEINRPVLNVMRELWAQGSTCGMVPNADDEGLPNKPVWLVEGLKREDMTPDQAAVFTDWRRQTAQVHDTNIAARSKRMQFSRMMLVARRFENEPAFYFPHQLDFRGRGYAVPLFLHPQGNDACRGLLCFSNTVPIGKEEGGRWLAIHGAGLWGVDKIDMDERVQWVIDNQAAILASAESPFDCRFWASAEKPWQALAFCFEWAGYQAEGYEFESAISVQMDGTCNGLQHFSAMLRDAIGGAAVNLVPGDRPNDIYQTVADLVALRVAADSTSEVRLTRKILVKNPETGKDDKKEVDAGTLGELARGWLGKVNRKVTKRPVMTLAYGAREFGFNTQVFDDTVKPWKSKAAREGTDDFPWNDNGWAAAAYMGGLIWECVGEVVVAARGVMDWLQTAAKSASAQGLPVTWTTPAGLKVMQAYHVATSKRLRLTFDSIRIRAAISQDTAQLDQRKQETGIAPNFVHSLDAAHMQLTVNACRARGIKSFSLIHDSYGTHAGNAWAMAQCLREEFVRMYEDHDVLSDFKREMEAQIGNGEPLPDLPPVGSLDLSEVLESQFFFA